MPPKTHSHANGNSSLINSHQNVISQHSHHVSCAWKSKKKWPKVAISASTKWPFSAHKWAIKVVRSKMQSIKSNYLLQKKIKAKLMLRSRTWKENLSKGSEMVLVYMGVHLGYLLDTNFVIFCILYSPLVCYKKLQQSKKNICDWRKKPKMGGGTTFTA